MFLLLVLLVQIKKNLVEALGGKRQLQQIGYAYASVTAARLLLDHYWLVWLE